MILRYIKHYSVITLQTCMCATLNLFLHPVSIEGQWCERRRPPLPSASGLQKCLCTHGPISSTSGGTWTQSCPACSLSPKIFKGRGGPPKRPITTAAPEQIPQSLRTTSQLQVILSLEHHFKALRVTLCVIALPSRLTLRGAGEIVRGEKEEWQVKKRVGETDRVSERLEQETGC